MTTDLIIQVLTEDDAFLLKERIFKDLAKKVKGTYSETFGLKISFADWLDPDLSKIVAKFLYDESVPKLIGMKPSELGYYEYQEGWGYCEEVNFTELFPDSGFYNFDPEKTIQLEYSTDRIFYKGKGFCYLSSIDAIAWWVQQNDDPLIREGLSKIYRRGYFLGDLRIKWKNELKNILLF